MADENQEEKCNNIIAVQLPHRTSLQINYPDILYQLFKVRACIFEVETILWPANICGRNVNNWFESGPSPYPMRFYEVYFDYLDKVLQYLNVEPRSWYGKSDLESSLEAMFAQIRKAMRSYVKGKNLDDITVQELRFTEAKLTDWLILLREILEMNTENISEKSFEDLTRRFFEVVGFTCYSGTFFPKSTFQYLDKNGHVVLSVSNQPDLLICNRNGTDIFETFAVAMVEVTTDAPLWNTIRNRSGPVSSTSSEDEHYRQASHNEEDLDDCSFLKEDYPNGNPRLLNVEEMTDYSAFLPQLLGEVIAAVSCPKKNLCSLPLGDVKDEIFTAQSVVAFGVVGFKVYVVNISGVRRDLTQIGNWTMHQIPCIRGMGLDVLVSEPLSILKPLDRNKLFKLIFALKNIDYTGPNDL